MRQIREFIVRLEGSKDEGEAPEVAEHKKRTKCLNQARLPPSWS